MNKGSYVFSQLVKALDEFVFLRIVKKYDGDKYVKHFSCWNQLLTLMFGQLTGKESLRRFIVASTPFKNKFYGLGLGKNVTRSNLSKANNSRDYRIFEEFANHMVRVAQKKRIKDIFKLHGKVYAFDSTTIDLCLSVYDWAHFRRAKGGIKVHTLFDLEAQVPTIFHITKAKVNDVNGMDMTKYHNIAMRYKNDGLLRVIRDYVSMVKSDPDTENDVWVESKTEHLVVVGNNRTDEIARLWGHDGIHVGITFFDDVDAEHRYSRFKMSNVASVFKPYTIDGKACPNADELPVDELQFYADFGYDAEGSCQVALQILSDIYEDRIEDLVYEIHNPQDDKIRIEAKQAEWRQSPEGKKEKRKDILTIAALVVGAILYIIIRSII